MGITITNPFGVGTFDPQNHVLIGGVRWDPGLSINVELLGNDLTASSATGFGQGACVFPEVSQTCVDPSAPDRLVVYWEVTWAGLLNSALQGGIGICTVEAIANYGALAATGLGGCILRPDGTVWVNGQVAYPPDPGFKYLPTQSEGDTIGIYVYFYADRINVIFLGAGGGVLATGDDPPNLGGVFELPIGHNYIPCVVFGTASTFDLLAVTAKFEGSDFLGLTANPTGFEGVHLGWPNGGT